MDAQKKVYIKNRNIGRRKIDRTMRDRLNQYKKIFFVSQAITSEINMEKLFEIIMEQTNRIMGTERCTIFLYHKEDNKLWSLVATGVGKDEIRIEAGTGVAGWVYQNKTPLIVSDAYADSRFYPIIDKLSGFRTKNILSIPLFNKNGECIGVLQALNKISEDFTDDDLELLKLVSNHVAISLENSKLYEDLKVLDKARERIINHMSHEIKTPLAVISSAFKALSEEYENTNIQKIKKVINRGQRNLMRLMEFQMKADDILNQKYVLSKERFLNFVQDAFSIVEELREKDHTEEINAILDLILKRLKSIYPDRNITNEVICLNDFLNDICMKLMHILEEREVKLIRDFDKDIKIVMDRSILKTVCLGLLKNAIENTPDEGQIAVGLVDIAPNTFLYFQDYGVGITSENQKLIFGGFFHTQDTKLYTTKNPYEFNAGGSGSDLLRIKVFSERFGFDIHFMSSRCKFIPKDTDICPGKISACKNVSKKTECFSSGGSKFTVKFPAEFNQNFRVL